MVTFHGCLIYMAYLTIFYHWSNNDTEEATSLNWINDDPSLTTYCVTRPQWVNHDSVLHHYCIISTSKVCLYITFYIRHTFKSHTLFMILFLRWTPSNQSILVQLTCGSPGFHDTSISKFADNLLSIQRYWKTSFLSNANKGRRSMAPKSFAWYFLLFLLWLFSISHYIIILKKHSLMGYWDYLSIVLCTHMKRHHHERYECQRQVTNHANTTKLPSNI